MGNVKKDAMNIKEESRRLYDLLKILQEEKDKLESIVQKEQLNTRFMSFYNSSKNKLRRGDRQNAVALVNSLMSGKAPTFAAVGNNGWSQRARSAASPDIKTRLERAKRAMEDKLAALLGKSIAGSSAFENAWEEMMRDIEVKFKKVRFDKESSVATRRYRDISTTTKEFWRQILRGDVSRRVPFIYIEARCSRIVELPVTTDVRVRFKTTQFDQERSVTLWRELCDSPAISNVLDRVTANGWVVSEGRERDVKFQIAMWAESDPDFNSAWERLKNATVVSTSSNGEKNIVEVAVHQGVSISIEGFLFEANTNLPLNNNTTMFNNNGRQSISSGSLEYFRLRIENSKETYNNDSVENALRIMSLNTPNTHLLRNNNTTLNYDKSRDDSSRRCSGVTQIPEMALDCLPVNTVQRNMEPLSSMSGNRYHGNSHQFQKYFE